MCGLKNEECSQSTINRKNYYNKNSHFYLIKSAFEKNNAVHRDAVAAVLKQTFLQGRQVKAPLNHCSYAIIISENLSRQKPYTVFVRS